MTARQPRFFVLASAAMLSCSSYIFSVSIGLPYIFVASSCLLALSLFLPFRVRYNDRSVIYSIVVSLAMAVILDLLFPMDRDKFMLVGEILFINVSAPFLIYFCAFITFFEFNIHIPGLVSAISIVLLLLTADIQKGGDTATKLPFFSFSGRNQDRLFMAAMMAQLVLLVAVSSYGKPRPGKKTGGGPMLTKWAAISIALACSAALLLSSMQFYNVFEANIRKMEGFFLKYGMRNVRRGTNYMSSRSIDLRKPMREQFMQSREQIILRASSKGPPGYLRGRVYDHYSSGNWLPASMESRKLNSRSYEGILVYRTYFLGDRAMQYPEKTEFIYSGDFKTDILLAPGNYEQIELVAGRLSWNRNGTLSPEEWEKDGGYTVFTKSHDANSAYNAPGTAGDEDLSVHMAVPENILPLADAKIAEIFDGHNISSMDDAAKAERIREHFISNFKYSLDFSMDPRDDEPLETFFRKKKGHCELFASSAVLISRRLGMPARYVTGFLCFEKHPLGSYYVSRLDNAHAWAEVYLRDQGRWMLLEATPEDGIPSGSSAAKWGLFKSYSDYFYKLMQSILADVRRGFFAKAVLAILVSIYEVFRDVVWHPLRGPLLAIAFLLFFLLKKITGRRRRRGFWKISDETLALADEFAAFERKLSARSGIKRDASETISEWISRVAGGFPAIAVPLASFSESYQTLRFGNSGHPRRKDADRIRSLRKSFPWAQVRRRKN